MNTNRRDFITGAVALGAIGATRNVPAGFPLHLTDEQGVFSGMRGAFSAMYTPYNPDFSINENAIEKLVEFGLKNGLKGFYVTGSTGESMLLSPEERARVVARVVKTVNGRGKVIAHVGYASSDDAVRCAKLAAKAGADWVSAVAPGFLARRPEEVYNHYRLIAGATDLPFLIYSWGDDVNPDRDAKLFDIPNVKGMKYTANNFYNVKRLKRKIGKEAIFFMGNDPMLLPALAYGNVFSGGIGLFFNQLPRLHAQICDYAFKNDFATAAKYQEMANVFLDAFGSAPYPERKAIMKYMGIDCGPCRHPHLPVSEQRYAEICAKLDELGIVKRNEAIA